MCSRNGPQLLVLKLVLNIQDYLFFQVIVLQIRGNPKPSISKALFNRFSFKIFYSTLYWHVLPIGCYFPDVKLTHKILYLQLVSLKQLNQEATLPIFMTRKTPLLLLQSLGHLRVKAWIATKRKWLPAFSMI